MFSFFENISLDDKYNGLRSKVTKYYPGNDKYKQLLLDKIETLKLLEKEYPQKESIHQAFGILDNISKKDFRDINSKITKLQKTVRDDTMEFSFIKSCISLVFLPILLPLLILEMILAITAVYRFMMLMQIALLAAAITLTMLFLPPLMLLATIPAALILNHLLSELVLDMVIEQIIYEIGAVFSSLFYEQNEPLKKELDEIVDVAKGAQYHIEGSAARRFFRNAYQQLTSCFSSEDSEQEEDQTLVYGM